MRIHIPWITAALVVSVLVGTAYVLAQQEARLSANDEPGRLASQVASELRTGSTKTVDSLQPVQLKDSLATWVVVVGPAGSVGSGYENGALASLPKGVLDTARRTGEDNVTWRSASGQRFATVSIAAGNSVVTAGQSLVPTERRIDAFTALAAFGWLAAMVLLATGWLTTQLGRRRAQT